MPKTYKTFGQAVADPDSAISRFMREGERLRHFNPTTVEEWTDYLAWQRERPRGCDRTTLAWRVERGDVVVPADASLEVAP